MRVNSLHGATGDEGPVYMSPVTGLARLPGRILLSVIYGKFQPIRRDKIQETQPKWWTIGSYHLWL